jgi:catechol 2,3-dioxygenase-like lactoylglutathione lyase family enzyme
VTLQERIDFYVDVCGLSPVDAEARARFEADAGYLHPVVPPHEG